VWLERLLGTWHTPQLDEWRSWFDHPDDLLLIAACVVAIVFLLLGATRSAKKSRQSDAQTSENARKRAEYQRPVMLPKVGNRGIIDRSTNKWIEPLHLAGRTIETKDKHMAIGATTGARKTTLIANLIMQANRPCVVIAGDSSPYALEAMRARGWRVWSADGRNGGLYCFEGSPREAAQIIAALFKMGQADTGLQRGMAVGVFRNAIAAMDEAGQARSWSALRKALLEADPPDGLTNRNFEAAKVAWLARIDSLIDTLGAALGHDISVLELVRSECGLFFDLNAFSDMDMASRFGELAVRLTQHAADKTGDFWWICDELGLFDADLLGQIVRTCRIRRVKFVGASQIISDFGKTLRGLVKVWFVGEQTAADHESRRWCSDLTMGLVPAENFAEHATPPGFYYVVADGRVQDLQIAPWHHPKPAAPMWILPSRRPTPSPDDPAPVSLSDSESPSRTMCVESDSELPVYGPVGMPEVYEWAARTFAAYPGIVKQLRNIWEHHTFPRGLNGCYESAYHTNNRGRPSCSLNGEDWTTYILIRTLEHCRLWEMTAKQTLAFMSQVKLDTASGRLTVDHVEGCENEICDRPEHLAWEDRGRNSELYHDRKRGDIAAD
jgi:hypothetical protein